MASGGQQLRLLLWKDYLLRKRKPITIGGIVWAAAALMSLVIVRMNVDPLPQPTCEFSARALPSAGVSVFLQSFLCTLSNDCDPLDRYQEIPDYSHTRLKQYQDQFAPIFEDTKVKEVMESLPGAGRLLATLTRTIDHPQLHQIVRKGLRVSDIFKNPEEVKDILVFDMKVKRSALDNFLDSKVSFQNIVEGVSSGQNFSCNVETVKKFFDGTNEEDVELIVGKFCEMRTKDVEKIFKQLIMEIDIRKYMKMIGEIINKLTGSDSVSNLGDMLDAVLRLTSVQNYFPKELQLHKWLPKIVEDSKQIKFTDFSYVNMDILYRLLNLFEPLFKNSDIFKKIYNTLETLSSIFTTLQSTLDNNVSQKMMTTNATIPESVGNTLKILLESDKDEDKNVSSSFYKLSKKVELFTTTLKSILKKESLGNVNPLDILTSMLQFVMDALPKKSWYDMSYYLTLLNKLLIGGHQSARLHLHVEEIMLQTCRRHPQGVQLIGKLGPNIVAKIIDGFSDADRIQAFTGKIFHPGQMFCDLNRIQTLLKMSRQQAQEVRPHLCNNAWKAFVTDVITSFGVYNASKTINEVASLVVSETLGNSVQSQFVTVGDIIGNMSALVTYIRDEVIYGQADNTTLDWEAVFNISNFKEIKQVVQSKLKSSNIVLVTIHTALAREVIAENRILDTYISPIIIQLGSVLSALSQQLDTIPQGLMKGIQQNFVQLSELVFATLSDKEKTINIMLSDHEEAFCGLVKNCSNTPDSCESLLTTNEFVVFPSDVDKLKMTKLLCNMSTSVANKLQSDLKNDKLLQLVKSLITDTDKDKSPSLNWNQLIKIMQQLYLKMDSRFGFVFSLNLLKDEDVWYNTRILAERMWQSDLFNGHVGGAVQLSATLYFRLMDLVDNRLFGLNDVSEHKNQWSEIKTKTDSVNSMLYLLNQFVEMLSAFMMRDEDFSIKELPVTSSHLRDLAFNFAPLIRDVATFIATKQMNISSIAQVLTSSPAWPCDPSGLGPILGLGPRALQALRGAEALMCNPADMRLEWKQFTHFTRLKAINSKIVLDIQYSEHVFLKTGRNFVNFVGNIQNLATTVNDVGQIDDGQKGGTGPMASSAEFSVLAAWEDAVKIIEENNQNFTVVKQILKNMDLLMTILNVNETDNIDPSLPPARLWEAALSCETNANASVEECRSVYWKTVKYTVWYIAEGGQQLVNDLTEYFSEISEPGANALQLIGFTKKTGPYILMNRLPGFIDVLLNSFLDQGFMKQVTQASDRNFWDCERIMDSLKVPSSGSITRADVQLIRPYICPSIIHWVSIPTDENVLFDLLSKTQFIFFNKPASNYSASFAKLFESSRVLVDVMKNVNINNTKRTYSLWDDDWLDKFENIGQTLIANGKSVNISRNDVLDSTYINDGLNMVYLSKISLIVYEISSNLNKINKTTTVLQSTSDQNDLKLFLRQLNRKTKDIIEMFIYAVTEKLKTIDDYETFDLVSSLDDVCNNESKWTKEYMWMKSNPKNIKHFCKTDYKRYIQLVSENKPENDTTFNDIVKNFVEGLVNMNNVIKSETNIDDYSWKDIFNNSLKLDSQNPAAQLKSSLTYVRELGLLGFLHYQQNRIQYFSVVVDFVTGGDWWTSIRHLLTGQYTTLMMEVMESSPDILDDIVTNMAKLKIVRLVKDIKLNNTGLLCGLNISEYIPDKTGLISKLKNTLCQINKTALYLEIAPLRVAEMVYDESLEINEDVHANMMIKNIQDLEDKLSGLLETGAKPPKLPSWITSQHRDNFYSFDLRMMQESTKIDVAFLLLNNVIDMSTLFVNSTYSPISSALTPWVKQVNLQLIKAEDYATLVCELPSMTLEEVHTNLLENFHWDLALSEIVSGRNYTWTELNKSLNQLLDIARHQSHETLKGKMDRVTDCLLNSTDSQPMNKAAMYISLGSRVMKLIRAMVPHFKEIEGFPNSPIVQRLSAILLDTVPVLVPMEEVVANKTLLKRDLRAQVKNLNFMMDDLLAAQVDLNKISSRKYNIFDTQQNSSGPLQNVTDVLSSAEQQQITDVVLQNLDQEYLKKNLPDLRSKSFWSFSWLQGAVHSVEGVLLHSGQLLQVLSKLEWKGLARGDPLPTIDLLIHMLRDDFVTSIVYRLNAIIEELHPLLSNLSIEHDLMSMSRGIQSVTTFRNELVSSLNLKLDVSKLFHDWENLKVDLENQTVLTRVLLDELQFSTVDFGAVLTPENGVNNIEDMVCGSGLSRLIQFNSTNITLKEVSSQLCDLGNTQIKKMAMTLMRRINFTYVFDIAIDGAVKQVMKASDLTEEQGARVVRTMGRAASLLPTFEGLFSNVSQILKNEPLLQSFQNVGGIADLLANNDFLVNAGNMVCGKPFYTKLNRFYSAITELKDNNDGPNQQQLDSLPTDYCRNLHREVVKMGGGKILWSYAKPLLMGRILYTPDTPQVRQIITAANSTFSQIGQLTSLLKQMVDGFSSLDEIILHKASLATMQILAESKFIHNALAKVSSGDSQLNLTEINLDDLISQFGDTATMKKLVTKMSQMTDCISLDRFVPMETEYLLEQEAGRLAIVNEFLAGVVFMDSKPTSENHKMYTNIQYKIRMDIDNVPSTSRIKNQFWAPGPDADFIDNLRYFRGFVQLQDLIDKAIIETRVSSDHSLAKREASNRAWNVGARNDVRKMEDWAVYTQQMPYACWTKDDFQMIMYEAQALIVAFFFCLILTVSSVVRNMVWERESGNTALMCVMGMKRRYHTASWLAASALEVLLTMVALCAVLKVGEILPNSDTGLLLLMLLNFGLSIVMFCYMISSMFRSASFGAVSAAILYLLSYMPFIIIIAMEADLSLVKKMAASLSMSSAFSYGLLQTARYEVQGSGLRWFNIWGNPQDNMSIAVSCIMVFVDSVIYGVIGWIINSLCFRDNIKTGVIGNVSDSTSQGIGVRIDGLTKVYSRSTTQALSNVSLDLKKGHITTLLGHNGAGKTTLIKILTGMVKPTSGKIIINEESSEKKLDAEYEIKNHIGLCPQFDVLLDVMSAREHLTYYAQLKTGLPNEDVKLEVESMLDALGLGRLSVEPVHKLSGGLRRRLCVGLAFIAHPHLVVLDEPSSGVDPVARRHIWSLIQELKSQRTILLTTHHLDEAEILSDTVVIMHKGKIHASGSPISLKHQHGEGYKLTVIYPLTQSFIKSHTIVHKDNETNGNIPIQRNGSVKPTSHGDSVAEVNHGIKELMEAVTNVVANAKIIDVKAHEVEINLPFLDDKGLNNDFLALTESLEAKQPELKYSSLGMDCSTLEQVFLSLCGGRGELEGKGEADHQKWDPESSDSGSSSTEESGFGSKTPSFLPVRQMWALLLKRFLHYTRNPRLLTAALLLPTLFVAIAMGFSLIRPPPDSHQPLQLHNDMYGSLSSEFVSFPESNDDFAAFEPGDNIISGLIQTSRDSGNRTLQFWIENDRQCECVEGWQVCQDTEGSTDNSTLPEKQIVVLPSMKAIVHWIVNSQDKYVEKRYGGWSLAHSGILNETAPGTNQSKFVIWYNNKGQHSLPAYLNALNNVILKERVGGHVNITTFSHPLKLSPEQLSKSSLLQHVADVGISVVLLIGFSLVPAVSAVFLVGERTSQQKRLQLLSSVHPITYWMASLVWDVMIIIAAIILSVVVFQIFELPVYVSRDNLSAICVLLFLYGISSSCLVHLLEKLFTEASLANMVIFCTNVFVSAVGLTILLIIDVITFSDLAKDIRWTLHKIFLLWPGFSLGDGLVLVSRNSIQADVLARFGLDTYVPPLSWDLLGPHCVALVATAVFFLIVNVAIELNVFNWLLELLYKPPIPPFNPEEEDCDVATERYRVELATLKAYYNVNYREDPPGPGDVREEHGKQPEPDVVQVVGLVKRYSGVLGARVAVNNVTFGVQRGQCFGLLGVNGAGKSTTFSMLTGELRPTGGYIYLRGQRVSQTQLCNGDIAYCPQNDALDPLLTLTEHLEFYCRIRGLRHSKRRIKEILAELEIARYRNQRAGTLSGGNKRKLCLAVALLSDSTLVLLDEPTSGMDPGARQRAGQALTKAARGGRALLLSTHSLLECEALCSATALMWGGRLLAMGPPSHLKLRYGRGHVVTLVTPPVPPPMPMALQEWPSCRLLSSHPPCLQLLLPPPCPLSLVFRGIANISTQLTLRDYSITQSSLDQVFINISNSQEEVGETVNKISPGIRLSTLERHYSQPSIFDAQSTSITTKC